MTNLFFKRWRARSVIIFLLLFAFSLAVLAPSASAWAPPDPQTDLTREAEDDTDGHPWNEGKSPSSSAAGWQMLLGLSTWLSLEISDLAKPEEMSEGNSVTSEKKEKDGNQVVTTPK